jgi:hypothetical protein
MVCTTIAVDDSESARPATIAACQGRPAARPPSAAEDRPAQAPHALGIELEADQKEHQHHAELGKVQDGFDVLHEAEAEGADHGACNQVAEHGAELEARCERHEQHGRSQVHHRVEQKAVVAHALALASAAMKASSRSRYS